MWRPRIFQVHSLTITFRGQQRHLVHRDILLQAGIKERKFDSSINCSITPMTHHFVYQRYGCSSTCFLFVGCVCVSDNCLMDSTTHLGQDSLVILYLGGQMIIYIHSRK